MRGGSRCCKRGHQSLELGKLDWSLIANLRNGEYLEDATHHRDIVAKFGRFPHRNVALGRQSTPEEVAFLTQPGSGF